MANRLYFRDFNWLLPRLIRLKLRHIYDLYKDNTHEAQPIALLANRNKFNYSLSSSLMKFISMSTALMTMQLPSASQLENLLEDHILITGGHFMIGSDGLPQLNQGTINSFRKAVELFVLAKRQRVMAQLGLFINDIGLTCEASGHCSLKRTVFSKEQFVLPDAYQEILDKADLSSSDLQLFWEKTVRNQGAELFKKWKHTRNTLFEKDETGYWLHDKELFGRILLRRQSGLPTCPLIMAALTHEQCRLGFSSSLNIYYIDVDNKDNIPNHFVIEKGKRVAELLGARLNVNNVYVTNQNMLVNF